MVAKFEIYKGKIGDFYWKLTHDNGHVIAKSGEGYTTKANAINGLNSVRNNAPSATVKDRTDQRTITAEKRLFDEFNK
ncbi:YegP family protein [Chloroflexota bacterium]